MPLDPPMCQALKIAWYGIWVRHSQHFPIGLQQASPAMWPLPGRPWFASLDQRLADEEISNRSVQETKQGPLLARCEEPLLWHKGARFPGRIDVSIGQGRYAATGFAKLRHRVRVGDGESRARFGTDRGFALHASRERIHGRAACRIRRGLAGLDISPTGFPGDFLRFCSPCPGNRLSDHGPRLRGRRNGGSGPAKFFNSPLAAPTPNGTEDCLPATFGEQVERRCRVRRNLGRIAC